MKIIKEIIKKIKEYDTIIIHGHEHPDGDCLGSQLGLKDIIKATWPNKKVFAVGESSDYLSFMGELDTIDDETFKGALSIIVDLANSERASDKRFNLSDFRIRIDHHIKVEEFANIEYIDDKCSSCAELIANMAFDNKLKMTLNGAYALYTGIVTDTGRFKYNSITKRTFDTAGRLLDMGIIPQDIDNNLAADTKESLNLKGYVLSNFEMVDGKFAYIKLTRDIIERFGVTDEEAANNVNMLSTIKGVLTWALFIEYEDHKLKIRIRSKGPRINDLAAKYNGGGHAMASGAKMESWDDVEPFVKDMMDVINNYSK